MSNGAVPPATSAGPGTASTSPPTATDIRTVLEAAAFDDQPIVKFAKWLAALTAMAGALAGGLQVAGLPELSGLGLFTFGAGIILLGASLALAIAAVAEKSVDPLQHDDNDKDKLLRAVVDRSERRRSKVRRAAYFFGGGLILAAVSPLASTANWNPIKDVVAIEYSIQHDSLTHLSASAVGHGLQIGTTVQLEILRRDVVLSAGQAAANGTGQVRVQVEIGNLSPASDSFLIRARKDDVVVDSVPVTYERPAPKPAS
jgi:hypothetical protein